MTSVLLLTRDPDLSLELRRLVLAAGAEPVEIASPARAHPVWRSSAAVVLGPDLLGEAVAAGLGRRSGSAAVVVVARSRDALDWDAVLAVGADAVLVLPDDERALVLRLAEACLGGARRARCLGVVGASGGAGASVLSVALGLALARSGSAPVVVDTDPSSAGLDLLLAAEEEHGARWGDLVAVTGALAPESLRSALPVVSGLAVLSADRDAAAPLEALAAVIDSARTAYDVVLCDLPRGRPDVLEVVAPRCDELLLVVTADVRGVSAGRRALAALLPLAPVRLVIRRRRRGALEPEQVAAWLGAEVAAEVDDDPGLTAAVDRGDLPGARGRLGRTCDELAALLLAAS
ncbi:MAG TPA: septum site-determining protein Ssd [Candidatus Nanopelagicales bacterium]|nr:septum site-determining protein Ssd [Candidatus Nanopelagicales bacterium]